MSVASRTRSSMGSLTAGERKVARALLADYPRAGLGSAADLAGAAGVSAPTVVRFARSLGFAGYSDLSVALVGELGERTSSPATKFAARRSSGDVLRTVIGQIEKLGDIPAAEIDAAVGLGRKVSFVGRSMVRNMAIARDLGRLLGCQAHVERLRRTAVGQFNLDNAVSLEALARIVEDETLPQVLVPMTTALAGIPALAVTEPQALRLRAGQPVRVAPALLGEAAGDPATVRAMRAGELIALETALKNPKRPLVAIVGGGTACVRRTSSADRSWWRPASPPSASTRTRCSSTRRRRLRLTSSSVSDRTLGS